MANKTKKGGSKEPKTAKVAAPAAVRTETASEPAESPAEGVVAAKAALAVAAPDDHAGHDHGHGEAHGHHKPDRREIMVVFVVLASLTVLEVGVAKVPGIARALVGSALVMLAVTKAAIVGLYYMHLKSETRILKLTVAIPMATPAIYALVLITEAAWRLTR